MLFLAQILNRPVLDVHGMRLGWVEDLVLSEINLFPKVEAFVLARRGHGAVSVPWACVGAIDTAVHLRQSRDELPSAPLADDAIFLRRDILDKQIVDINGRKVVRVNDLQLATIDQELRLTGADIGARGLLRRLSLEGPVSALAKGLRTRLPERVIPWNYVEGLETEWPSVRLNISQRRLSELPPTDIADILAQLHPLDRGEMLQRIDDETLADALPHLEEDMQVEVISAMSDERASDIMEFLPPDEAADVLGDLSEERAERILHLMEPEEAEDVRELLRYEDDTAGGRMTTEYFALTDDITVRDALIALRAAAPDAEMIYYLYVIDAAGHLEGVLSLRDLITASEDTPIAPLIQHNVIKVLVTDDQETVARTLNHYHLLAVPVVDDANVLLGIVTVDDVLDVLHEEAEEDISRQAGETEESDVLATPWDQARLRFPWMLGAAAAGVLAALYLAFGLAPTLPTLTPLLALLPLLVLLGVQVGGQSAAVVQVGIIEEENLHDIFASLLRRQWLVGLALSLLGALISGLVMHITGAPSRTLAVAAMMLFALLLNMLLGSMLPLLLARLKWDPALISRPALAALILLLGVPLLAQAL